MECAVGNDLLHVIQMDVLSEWFFQVKITVTINGTWRNSQQSHSLCNAISVCSKVIRMRTSRPSRGLLFPSVIMRPYAAVISRTTLASQQSYATRFTGLDETEGPKLRTRPRRPNESKLDVCARQHRNEQLVVQNTTYKTFFWYCTTKYSLQEITFRSTQLETDKVHIQRTGIK